MNASVAACVIVTVFFFVNLFGLKDSARVQNVTTAILLLTLLSFVVLGLPRCDLSQMFRAENPFYGGWSGIFDACALVLFGVGPEEYPTIAPGTDYILEPNMVVCLETPYSGTGNAPVQGGFNLEDTHVITADGHESFTEMPDNIFWK